MNPLSMTYGALTYARNVLYDSGFFSAQLRGPVISVGSISAGGAGKTPFVIVLADLLKARGITFDVLSRGYGRKTRGVRLVDVGGEPGEFGDEPLLMARRLAVPVVVGENRYHAGLFAEQRFGPQLHLLDDGFQHRALARDFDIVLFTQAENADRLLPVGRLREPLSALARADAVAFSLKPSQGSNLPGPDSAGASSSPHYWRLHRRTVLPNPVPAKPIAFCGIARPHTFFTDLAEAGATLIDQLAFPDHHSYGHADVERLLKLRKSHSADGFVTTEKDVVNLGQLAAALQPLAIARVEMKLEDADQVISNMLDVVSARHRART